MYQERRVRILQKQLKASTRGKGEPEVDDVQVDFVSALRSELSAGNLQNFADRVDRIYKQAFYARYSDFSPREALCDICNTSKIREDLQTTFPLHFAAFRSLIFNKRNLQPADRKKHIYQQKEKSLVNHFCALIRLRNCRLLMHWSVIATLAMIKRGVPMRVSRNPIYKAFCCSKDKAFEYVDGIYEATKEIRRKRIDSCPFLIHSSDNYNCYHPHSIQVNAKAGIYHKGMVFNIVLPKEFNKPRGTVYRDPSGCQWRVVTSELKTHWTCEVLLTCITPPYVGRGTRIVLPLMGWSVVSMPGYENQKPALAYVDQDVPSALNMKVPKGSVPCDLIMNLDTWEGVSEWDCVAPRDYVG